MGFCALGLGFMKKKIEKWEWDFNLSNTGWDCGIQLGFEKKTISWEMGLGPPPLLHDLHEQLKDEPSFLVITDPAGQVTTFASLDAFTTLFAYISSK